MTKFRTHEGEGFSITDSNGTIHQIKVSIKMLLSQAGGVDKWCEADKTYTTVSGNNVGHINHKKFNLPGSSEWLPKDS